MNIKKLLCTDKHGRHNYFDCTVTQQAGKWCFRVRPDGASPESEFFELTVEEIDANTVRIIMMNNNRYAPVVAKGIPDALIPEIRRVLNRAVQSSPKAGNTFDIRRSDDADKVWQRLVSANVARHDQTADVYHLL